LKEVCPRKARKSAKKRMKEISRAFSRGFAGQAQLNFTAGGGLLLNNLK
jgi:hypothetical protein